jgi:hypothetical protein
MATMQDCKQMDKLTWSVDRQQGPEGRGSFGQITAEKRIWIIFLSQNIIGQFKN